jgi:hypothetical protein
MKQYVDDTPEGRLFYRMQVTGDGPIFAQEKGVVSYSSTINISYDFSRLKSPAHRIAAESWFKVVQYENGGAAEKEIEKGSGIGIGNYSKKEEGYKRQYEGRYCIHRR